MRDSMSRESDRDDRRPLDLSWTKLGGYAAGIRFDQLKWEPAPVRSTQPTFARMQRRESYDSLKICVFCMAAPGTTDEHIIPRGIGGRLVFKRATCQSCLKQINRYEERIINHQYAPARAYLGIKTKSGKPLSKFKGPRWDRDQNRFEASAYISQSEHSGYVWTYGYEPPGLEAGRPISAGLGNGCSLTFTPIGQGGDVPVLGGRVGGEIEFMPFIAKVAHAYWIAQNGVDNFEFHLQPIILNRDYRLMGYLLGQCDEPLPSDDLHTIRHGTRVLRGREWGYVDFALFAPFNTEAFQSRYRAYVGIIRSGEAKSTILELPGRSNQI